MTKKFKKPGISEYGFLNLYILTMVVQKQGSIIENHQLEKYLLKFYSDPKYYFLFEDIVKKEDKIQPENSYLDLSMAFQKAYAWGLLTMIQDINEMRSIVNFSIDEAKEAISQFPLEQVNAMKSLCTEVDKLRNINKSQ